MNTEHIDIYILNCLSTLFRFHFISFFFLQLLSSLTKSFMPPPTSILAASKISLLYKEKRNNTNNNNNNNDNNNFLFTESEWRTIDFAGIVIIELLSCWMAKSSLAISSGLVRAAFAEVMTPARALFASSQRFSETPASRALWIVAFTSAARDLADEFTSAYVLSLTASRSVVHA